MNELIELILKDFVATSDNDTEYCTIENGCKYKNECLTHCLDYYLEKNKDKYNTIDYSKRLESVERFVLMLESEFDKKLEMLRENNNLFAEEIKKLGGFKE